MGETGSSRAKTDTNTSADCDSATNGNSCTYSDTGSHRYGDHSSRTNRNANIFRWWGTE
jgi:hypothetical protein